MSTFAPYVLPYAEISWSAEDSPYADDYQDVYWSRSGGLAEKQFVFIKACELEPRWARLNAGSTFTVVETGFGFGINFLLTLRAWRQKKAAGRLEFISYEKHLVPWRDLQRAAATFGLEHELSSLEGQYPEPVQGPHVIKVSDNCSLTLVVGDAEDHLPQLRGALDAVFLDGFSPGKNLELWQDRLLRHLATQLRPGAMVSTYSVAGDIRRSLSNAGLNVEKAPGFGQKRHMLIATAPGDWQPRGFQRKHIAIIGAGLIGRLCALALEDRGYQVTLIDQGGKTWGAVRQIKQIAIYPQLSQTPQLYSNLYLRAFFYFLSHHPLHQCGRLELLETEAQQHKAEALSAQLAPIVEMKSPKQCSDILGLATSQSGLFNPSAGWLDPQSIASNHDVFAERVDRIEKHADNWRLHFDSRHQDFDLVVYATGPANLPALAPFNLMPLRGQSLSLKHQSAAPKCVVSKNKTWFPEHQGQSTLSGTYTRFDADLEPRNEDTAELLRGYQSLAGDQPVPNYSTGVGIRSATRDRLPIVGALPDWQTLDEHLQQDEPRGAFQRFESGCYVTLGFGSHGGTLGPYSAELLTRLISGDPVAENLSQLSPIRFALRDGSLS